MMRHEYGVATELMSRYSLPMKHLQIRTANQYRQAATRCEDAREQAGKAHFLEVTGRSIPLKSHGDSRIVPSAESILSRRRRPEQVKQRNNPEYPDLPEEDRQYRNIAPRPEPEAESTTQAEDPPAKEESAKPDKKQSGNKGAKKSGRGDKKK